ncbi:TIGR02206 family membrane protein [Bacillus suaedae]|uniref:TIGR02206 family membrane protein n=1 Tax=Halalkalibacter suaedae TaxID=2822140 RepID=A0A940WZ04_9BACI|nr:TIGR02206 family membrane protein [Bacillus suaedae]MBP3950694.1 TIGR02206 family membrane protein [Bacillus suaedae]
MLELIEKDAYMEPALFLSTAHLYSILAFVVLVGLLYYFRQSSLTKRYARSLLIASLVLSEFGLITWSIWIGNWDIRYNLPLQLCTISLYLCVYMLITKNRTVFEVVYFFGLSGALQALLTPDLFYTFPHFRFIHFFIAHFSIVLSILYMVWIEQFHITFRSFIKSFITLNAIALIAIIVNFITGANYMFLARKPTNASLIDFLGPYPWYILSLELIALIMFGILYIPFYFKKKSGGY